MRRTETTGSQMFFDMISNCKIITNFNIKTITILLLIFQNAKSLLPVAVRSVVFEDHQSGKRLTGSLLESEVRLNENKCALACNRHLKCRSFNFCFSLKCQLTSEDAFSVGSNFTSLLLDDPLCSYHGMLQDHRAECNEGEITKNIQYDAYPGSCQINKKRVDEVFGPWEQMPAIETANEWKKYYTRNQLIQSAHGGIISSEGTVKNIEWFKRVDSAQMNWTVAEATCEREGGTLFYNLDGTEEQLDFFYDIFGERSYWMGVFAAGEVHEDRWRTVRGDILSTDKLKWDIDNPKLNRADRSNILLSTFNEKSKPKRVYLTNREPSKTKDFFCDMLG